MQAALLSLNQIETLVEGVRFIPKRRMQTLLIKPMQSSMTELKAMFGKSLAVRKDLPIGHVISVSEFRIQKTSR
jgi:hypothetical protein